MAQPKTSTPIAVQLYSLRHLELPFEEILGHVSRIGYHGVETLADHGIPASEMNELLDRYNLKVSSTHVGLPALEENLDHFVTFNKAVGNDVLVVPFLPEEMRGAGAAGWQAVGNRLGEMARRCADAGMRLGYHNHSFEMEEFEGQLAIDWLLAASQADNVFWETDLAWIQAGEVDPATMLGNYTGRCPLIHAKDLAPAGENQDQMGLADVGYGVLDWETLLPAAQAAGAEWFIVEHDLPKDPLASIERSFDFLAARLAD